MVTTVRFFAFLPLFFSKSGYEPIIVVTHLDLICRDAIRQGRNWEVEVHHKRDKVRERTIVRTNSILYITPRCQLSVYGCINTCNSKTLIPTYFIFNDSL